MSDYAILRSNYLKKSLKNNKTTVGSWMTLNHLSIPEIFALSAKLDFLTVDMEHSSITLESAQLLLQVINNTGVCPLVRVGENNPNLIKRVMDAGAYGVIVPMINCAEDAQSAVNAVYYPPEGKRGVGLARAQGYGLDFAGYKKWLKSNAIVVAQIEHIQAIDNLKEIINTDGIDATIIGPYDLSASMGFPGEFKRKEIKEAINNYKKICKKYNKPMGIHVIPPDAQEVRQRKKEGFTFIAFSLDTLFLGRKIEKEFKAIGR